VYVIYVSCSIATHNLCVFLAESNSSDSVSLDHNAIVGEEEQEEGEEEGGEGRLGSSGCLDQSLLSLQVEVSGHGVDHSGLECCAWGDMVGDQRSWERGFTLPETRLSVSPRDYSPSGPPSPLSYSHTHIHTQQHNMDCHQPANNSTSGMRMKGHGVSVPGDGVSVLLSVEEEYKCPVCGDSSSKSLVDLNSHLDGCLEAGSGKKKKRACGIKGYFYPVR
jgi:hypothetical protein